MIIKVDAKTLEWRTYIEWSRDPVGLEEIRLADANPQDKTYDIHSSNQKRFQLPERVIAKVFLFRWIYRGSAWAYAHDPAFIPTSSSPKFWQKVIDAANEKYSVLYEFQNQKIKEVEETGKLVIPTGRELEFSMKAGKGGEWYWDIKDITNWPNQGFAADLMVIARCSLRNRIKDWEAYQKKKILLFNTVHDDIEIDVDNNPELLYNICIQCENVFEDVPANFTKLYGTEFVTPMKGEVSFGPNLDNLKTFDRTLGEKQFL